MAEQQLVDYIKKAKDSGQTDDQTKNLLIKNGWTEAEIGDAFMAISQPQQPEVKPQIQPQPQYQPQSMPSDMPKSRGGSGLILKLLIALIILIVLGGVGYFAAAQYLNLPFSISSFFGQSPESVIVKAIDNLETIKSQNFSSELALSGKNLKTAGNAGDFNVSFRFNGGEDMSNANNTLAKVQGSLTATATDSANPSGQYGASLSADAMLIQKDFYIKLNEASLGGLEGMLMAAGIPDLNTIKGQWIKFKLNDLSKDQVMQQIQMVSGKQAVLDQNIDNNLNRITKILIDKKVYDISQMPDNQGTEGKEYHYYVSLNQKKIIEASPEIFGILQESCSKDNSCAQDYNLTKFQTDINDAFAKIGKIGIDLFIGKTDNFFHKIQISKDFDLNKFDSQYSGILSVNYKIEQNGINQPVQVSAPADFKDYQEFFGPILKLQKIKTDIAQVRLAAQSVFDKNKSYSSLCIKGLLNGYLKIGLLELNNDIVSQGAKNPACFAAAQNYCVSTQLADNSFVCIDKNGIVGTTKCVSAQTECK